VLSVGDRSAAHIEGRGGGGGGEERFVVGK
jgi:hypothetical protein